MRFVGRSMEEEDWDEPEVASDQPRLARLMWFHVDFINMSTRMPDLHRQCFIVPLMEAFLAKHGASLMQWRQARFRTLYYTVQGILRELHDYFWGVYVTCPTLQHDLSAMRDMIHFLWVKYRGPHSTDTPVFMELSRRTTSDLAMRVFEYV